VLAAQQFVLGPQCEASARGRASVRARYGVGVASGTKRSNWRSMPAEWVLVTKSSCPRSLSLATGSAVTALGGGAPVRDIEPVRST